MKKAAALVVTTAIMALAGCGSDSTPEWQAVTDAGAAIGQTADAVAKAAK
jgi:hypothetical protein